MSAYEQWDKDFQDAMANEFRRGMEPIREGETLNGATLFSKGAGRHGEF
jgi:enoyl-CoA hydratase